MDTDMDPNAEYKRKRSLMRATVLRVSSTAKCKGQKLPKNQ